MVNRMPRIRLFFIEVGDLPPLKSLLTHRYAQGAITVAVGLMTMYVPPPNALTFINPLNQPVMPGLSSQTTYVYLPKHLTNFCTFLR